MRPWTRLWPDMPLPAPFLQCREDLAPKGSGVLVDPGLMDEEFRKAWLLFFFVELQGHCEFGCLRCRDS